MATLHGGAAGESVTPGQQPDSGGKEREKRQRKKSNACFFSFFVLSSSSSTRKRKRELFIDRRRSIIDIVDVSFPLPSRPPILLFLIEGPRARDPLEIQRGGYLILDRYQLTFLLTFITRKKRQNLFFLFQSFDSRKAKARAVAALRGGAVFRLAARPSRRGRGR